jgi:GR25 family glycosyltransferase involved in LPS biosynthesis
MNYMTFVINLNHRNDKYARFLRTFDNFELMHERFSAFYGKELINSDNLGDFEKILLKKLSINPKNPKNQLPGLFGCWLSHYSLWEKLSIDESNDFYVIFEDDVYITGDFEERYGQILGAISQRFDIYYIGGRYKESFLPKNMDKWQVYNVKGVDFYQSMDKKTLDYDHDRGLFSYVLTRDGAIKLINLLRDEFNASIPIAAVDGWINENRHKINVCDAFPHITWARIGEMSDIR